MPSPQSSLRHLPNILTVLRLLSMPFIAYILLTGQFYVGLFAYFFSGISDFFDGWMARRFSWQSKFGAIADPIADKLLVMIGYVCMAIQGAIPRWLAVLVIGRDVVIVLMAAFAFAFTKVRDFPPSIWGKWATTFQMLAVGATLMHYSDVWRVPLEPFFTLAAAFTVISGADYLRSGVRRLRTALA